MHSNDSFSITSNLASSIERLPLILRVVISALLAQALIIIVKRWREYREDMQYGDQHGCQPPHQLPNRWILGLDHLKELWVWNARGHLLDFLSSVAERYEPWSNLSQYMLFGPRVFHTLHHKNVEAVLSSNFKDFGFGVRPGVFAPLLGNGIFTQEGTAWKHSRELLRKQFIRTEYQNLDHFCEHVDNLIARLPARGVVDLQPLFFSLTLDTTTALLFGRSIYSLKADKTVDAENGAFADSFNEAQEGLAKRFRLAPLHFLYSPPSFRRACSTVHRFVENYIHERELQQKTSADDMTKYSFIDQLAAESPSTEDLRDQLLNVLLAGRDTAACCLSWTFRLLVRHESVLLRLRDEIRSVMGTSTHPTRDQIRRMPYLANVFKESLRLYPPVPLNNRTAIRTTHLPTGGGPNGTAPILVRRGELVIYSQYVNSRRRNVWGADAAEFHPERWDEAAAAELPPFALFPFSGGPRVCLGQDFALAEMSYAIVRLLGTLHSIALPEGERRGRLGEERQRVTLVLSCAEGCWVDVARD